MSTPSPRARPEPRPGTLTGTLPGMPARLWPASPSKLMTWLDCPARFRLTYLSRGVPRRVFAHQSLGTSVHLALREWWCLPPDERTPQAVSAILRRTWITDGYRSSTQAEQMRETAAGWVSRYVTDPALTGDLRDEPLGLERTVSTTTPRLALTGRVDRIDARMGEAGPEAVVIDYKTGRQPVDETTARTSLALAVYAAATQRTLRRPCRRVELHHLPTATVAVWEHTAESLQRQLRRADEIGAEAAAATEFPVRPGPLCPWCDVRDACPEGRSAGPAVESWAGLPQD